MFNCLYSLVQKYLMLIRLKCLHLLSSTENSRARCLVTALFLHLVVLSHDTGERYRAIMALLFFHLSIILMTNQPKTTLDGLSQTPGTACDAWVMHQHC